MTVLLFHTISDFLKAFGYVSAVRNSATNNFFLQTHPLCQWDTKHQPDLFSHLAKMLWNTTQEEEEQKEEEGRTHLEEKMNISCLFF